MTVLSVPDMTCGHCKASVEAALSGLPGVAKVTVDLAAHRVEVGGAAAPEAMLRALDEVGFPAEVVTAA
ncbi:heavy-metal-associated domain-containing protein [Neotabrizicola shimadae]|uniref:Heavy-metal-associated domain-containing protein n=1 Tax=Neotabrizicola shimadae TaxID=2807096 RepID=A0A8G1ED55_9RHOB|nr:heavy-metal-associated domain-containing protein [Neotabrizicola shimadae]QYZ71172.1 heavy-metal-associated domain-containing protein [Neotabrizicola shimadae]